MATGTELVSTRPSNVAGSALATSSAVVPTSMTTVSPGSTSEAASRAMARLAATRCTLRASKLPSLDRRRGWSRPRTPGPAAPCRRACAGRAGWSRRTRRTGGPGRRRRRHCAGALGPGWRRWVGSIALLALLSWPSSRALRMVVPEARQEAGREPRGGRGRPRASRVSPPGSRSAERWAFGPAAAARRDLLPASWLCPLLPDLVVFCRRSTPGEWTPISRRARRAATVAVISIAWPLPGGIPWITRSNTFSTSPRCRASGTT